ncbi:MAG: hypothetical protein H0U57_12290 [Tatlockia sp.]|nr:hypothetical protein [Tatlockia sp.]
MAETTLISDILPMIISAIVICIIAFSFFVTYKYRNPDQFKQTRINVFFSALASVAILFVGFNVVMTSIAFETNQKFARITKTKEAVDKIWLYPNELLKSSRNIRTEFRATFFMFNLDLYNKVLLTNKKSVLTDQGLIEEQFIASVMIQAWSDCLSVRNYDLSSLRFWLRGFLTWAQSPYLKSYYDNLKFEFATSTTKFADLLFEYAEKIPVPTTNRKLYIDAADKMMQDPRFITLLKSLT